MKDNQKIYIRGNKERWNEIKDILTGLGATPAECSCDDNFIYFINNRTIDCGDEFVEEVNDDDHWMPIPELNKSENQ